MAKKSANKPAIQEPAAAATESKPTEAQAAAPSKSTTGPRPKKKAAKKKPAVKAVKKKYVAKTKAAVPAVEVNKSEAIRQEFKKLGKQARPKDVVAALAAKGIKVAPAQVSMIKARLFAKSKAKKASGPATRTFSVADLEAAKKAADQLGGIKALQSALETLTRLR